MNTSAILEPQGRSDFAAATRTSLIPGRHACVLAHRWAGLTIALFLIVAGVTGSVLPFEQELTFLSRSDVAYVHPSYRGARPLDGIAIAERVERSTGGVVSYVPLAVSAKRVDRMYVAARPGRPPLPFNMVWADPYTGAVKLTYTWGGLRDGRVNIVPFLFSLHYGLVAGAWGTWAFGISGLIWTIDCFVGFYLTLPSGGGTNRQRGTPRLLWAKRWGAAWKVRRHARGHRLNFDLHRASGLWLWPLLLVFAWSSVGLLLPSVEQPVMRAFGATVGYVPPAERRPLVRPRVGLRQAVTTGERALIRTGRHDGFTLLALETVSYDAGSGTYRLDARTTLDRGAAIGSTSVWVDARNGALLHLDRPFGRTWADAVRHLLVLLHFAEIIGLPYRIFVSVLGLAVAMLSATGVLIWTKKRSARVLSRGRRAGPVTSPR
ncbi:PepSY-associated TM helix domain-containing protein [Sphingomonas bacterium]|uniref:PepSY-associated TM helix domain-containing protein n=1 Tax=Sphingomonas bacterium TaxID=1895847 RepID=UPI0020C5EC51|nr:PepSY-associated TM helix domain-containing protein [Sphingomonas bacterium]